MRCRVKLFARARDLARAGEVFVELSAGATVADLRRVLANTYPALDALLERSAIAVNNEFAEESTGVPAGAEVALLPPVSGG